MAITKILVVRQRMERVIDYANNPDKTSLENALAYATNEAKTETTFMQSTVNCMQGTAHADMIHTKRRWGKEGGVQAYHIIQSFKPGEATPQIAHEIGCELARRVFGERFEVVIGTHLDKSHLHNHLVVNSVSFADGYKFRSSFKDYFGDIRGTSDALCAEYGLSVIQGGKRGMRYGEWKHEQEDHVVWRDVVRRDMDEAIRESLSMRQFYANLRKRGYVVDVNSNHKYVTVRAPGMRRSVRMTEKSLGAEYTPESIAKRILRIPYIIVESDGHRRARLRGAYKPVKLKGLRALYFRYMYELGFIKKKPRRIHMSKELRAEVRKLESYAARMRLLNDHGIDTMERLVAHRTSVQGEIDELTRERAALHHKKERANDEVRYKLTRQTDEITARLRVLRREAKLCAAMEAESASLHPKIAAIEEINRDHASRSTIQASEQSPRLRKGPAR